MEFVQKFSTQWLKFKPIKETPAQYSLGSPLSTFATLLKLTGDSLKPDSFCFRFSVLFDRERACTAQSCQAFGGNAK